MNDPSLQHDDVDRNSSPNPTFQSILSDRLSRRQTLLGGVGALLGGWSMACTRGDVDRAASLDFVTPAPSGTAGASDAVGGAAPTPTPSTILELDFTPVPKSLADEVVVPSGYRVTVLYRLGDPIAEAVGEYDNDGSDSASSFAFRAGDHHDGMHYFGMSASGRHDPNSVDRALLVLNHESLTPTFLHARGQTIVGSGNSAKRAVASEVLKEMNALGVSVVEIQRKGDVWSYRKDSPKNRRITTLTPIELSGPAARSRFMITKYSPDGSRTRGTLNNCANGYTPWGTYLTCEENWAGYFRRLPEDDAERSMEELASFERYGVTGRGRELWATASPDTVDDLFGRFSAHRTGTSSDGSDDYRNAPNTFGWIVEIDPFDPTSTPKKRTALGRFAHEGCWPSIASPGKALAFYMGCDGRNEYIYKFVSARSWDEADATGGLAAGDKYLDEGTLYVAKFEPDGTGTWIELRIGAPDITPESAPYAFTDQADVLVNARLAADAVGATKMDRPEWGAVNSVNGEVYFTLTNTSESARPIDAVDAANPRFYDDRRTDSGRSQRGNPNGHVLRLAEQDGDPRATSFRWDIFLFGARAMADGHSVNVSGLTDENDLSSPDGAWFSRANEGLLWLQTDDGAYTDVTNCMLLASLPGAVGDGQALTIRNVDGSRSKEVETYVGAPLGVERLRRFLTGPRECEITGIAESPDGTTLFVNVQHPGEDTTPNYTDPTSFGSHWPDGGAARPRSATLAITREDGGVVGVTRREIPQR